MKDKASDFSGDCHDIGLADSKVLPFHVYF